MPFAFSDAGSTGVTEILSDSMGVAVRYSCTISIVALGGRYCSLVVGSISI